MPGGFSEQLGFKLEKIIGIKKHAGKVRKNISERLEDWNFFLIGTN